MNSLKEMLAAQGGFVPAMTKAAPVFLGMGSALASGQPVASGISHGLATMMDMQDRERGIAEKQAEDDRRLAEERRKAAALEMTRGTLAEMLAPPPRMGPPVAVTPGQSVANDTMRALGKETMAGVRLPHGATPTPEQRDMVIRAATEAGVDPGLFMRVVAQESAFKPDVWSGTRLSTAGAIGPAQLMPGTASDLGVDPYDQYANLVGGARYLKQQLDTFGDPGLALAAYNAGPGRVREAGGIPNIPETRNYVRSILGEGPQIDPNRAAAILTSENVPAAVKQMVLAQFQGEEPEEAPGADEIAALRKEFSGLKIVKDFSTQAAAYGRMVASAEDPSAAGDMALIFNYMKVLDPDSTVLEGEYATARNATGVPQRVINLYNQALTGQTLSPEQRMDFLDRADRLYGSAEQQFSTVYDQYSNIAAANNYPVDRALVDFRYTGPRAADLMAGMSEGASIANDAMSALAGVPSPPPQATAVQPTPTIRMWDGAEYTQDQIETAAKALSSADIGVFLRIKGQGADLVRRQIDYLRRKGVLK